MGSEVKTSKVSLMYDEVAPFFDLLETKYTILLRLGTKNKGRREGEGREMGEGKG